MSGGMAFVLDENDEFAARCNQEIVDLEEPSEDDFADVRALVEEHLERTGSTVAERVLRDWDDLRGAWVKVMPLDFKRALRELAERREIDAGEPAVIAEHGNGDGSGPVRAGQADAYTAADGHEEARKPGQAGQHEDAAVAAERAYKEALARGASEAEAAQAAEEAEEEVLPSHG
jgi:hypothetical protein